MQIIAKVFEICITESELQIEYARLYPANSVQDPQQRQSALQRTIDRALLIHDALTLGVNVEEEEFDTALLEVLDGDVSGLHRSADSNDNAARSLEELVRHKIILKKHIKGICSGDQHISDAQVRLFYDEQCELFLPVEERRVSHILIKGSDEDSLKRITELRKSIQSPEEFIKASQEISDCPSNCQCGDLGFFTRSQLLKEIEDVAFSLKINEISQPFNTQYGYHILMLTDKRKVDKSSFEELKEVLRARLAQIEREYKLVKYVVRLREKYSSGIQIYAP